MNNLRNYEALIRECVDKINARDNNWTWSIESFAEDRVSIRWSYLDYCEEKNNCFFLVINDEDREFDDVYMSVRTPRNKCIEGEIVTDSGVKKSWQSSFENGIRTLIDGLYDYANSRY